MRARGLSGVAGRRSRTRGCGAGGRRAAAGAGEGQPAHGGHRRRRHAARRLPPVRGPGRAHVLPRPCRWGAVHAGADRARRGHAVSAAAPAGRRAHRGLPVGRRHARPGHEHRRLRRRRDDVDGPGAGGRRHARHQRRAAVARRCVRGHGLRRREQRALPARPAGRRRRAPHRHPGSQPRRARAARHASPRRPARGDRPLRAPPSRGARARGGRRSQRPERVGVGCEPARAERRRRQRRRRRAYGDVAAGHRGAAHARGHAARADLALALARLPGPPDDRGACAQRPPGPWGRP